MAGRLETSAEVASLMGLSVTSAENLMRTLKQAGLRTSGARGRGAPAMQPTDVFLLTAMLGMQVPPRDVPEVARRLLNLPLQGGERDTGHPLDFGWVAPKGKGLLAALVREALPGIRSEPTFGQFASYWISHFFMGEPELSSGAKMSVTITTTTERMYAIFNYVKYDNRLELRYGDAPCENRDDPTPRLWERKFIMDAELLRRLAILVAGPGSVAAASDDESQPRKEGE